ncbi:hypothetical protein K501DRAFT_309944 [Backusella circina FSU 941]|nr:hypothetical protein K501DRAFT_309944 [Backusella circina FSU 941]
MLINYPFIDTIQFQDLRANPTTLLNKYGIAYGEIKKAMLDYLGRLTGSSEPKFVDWHNMQEIELSERVWSDSMVYACSAYKENDSEDFKRDGFCYFTIKQNNNPRSMAKWYVGRIVLFLNFSFFDDDDGSTYALVEPMGVNGVSSFDGTIPRVKAYATDARKYALVDVGELDGSVGLLTDVDCSRAEKESRRRVEAGNVKSFKYIIRPGRAFPRLLASSCGNPKDLFVTNKRYSDQQ